MRTGRLCPAEMFLLTEGAEEILSEKIRHLQKRKVLLRRVAVKLPEWGSHM